MFDLFCFGKYDMLFNFLLKELILVETRVKFIGVSKFWYKFAYMGLFAYDMSKVNLLMGFMVLFCWSLECILIEIRLMLCCIFYLNFKAGMRIHTFAYGMRRLLMTSIVSVMLIWP